jgi:membrane protein Man1
MVVSGCVLRIVFCFSPGDDWPVQIQDALLRRCEGVPIVHVAVDRESKDGTVYMKCLDEDASGRAYNLLHGHWFDGQLVTVKYLLADRYHTRFPQARDVRVPIQPIAR